MKKRFALAAAFAFSVIPFTSFADHLEPDENQIKKGGELVSTKLRGYDLFSNNFSDDILIALTVNGYVIEPGADLSGADLRGADLSGADLSGADLSDAILNGADLSDADLSDADLSGAELNENIRRDGANLDGADLSGADLSGADLSRTTLRNTDLSDAILNGTDLSSAILHTANLEGADLRNTDLTSTNLRNANLKNTNLRNADLNGANLVDADLSGADLTDVIAENLNSCPSVLPIGWDCKGDPFIPKFFYDDSLVVEEEVVEEEVVEEEVVEEETFFIGDPIYEDIDFDSITVESLPYSVGCMPKGKMLKIKQNKKEKFVVRFHKGKKFYKGFDFDEAVDVFEETYEDKCVE